MKKSAAVEVCVVGELWAWHRFVMYLALVCNIYVLRLRSAKVQVAMVSQLGMIVLRASDTPTQHLKESFIADKLFRVLNPKATATARF